MPEQFIPPQQIQPAKRGTKGITNRRLAKWTCRQIMLDQSSTRADKLKAAATMQQLLRLEALGSRFGKSKPKKARTDMHDLLDKANAA